MYGSLLYQMNSLASMARILTSGIWRMICQLTSPTRHLFNNGKLHCSSSFLKLCCCSTRSDSHGGRHSAGGGQDNSRCCKPARSPTYSKLGQSSTCRCFSEGRFDMRRKLWLCLRVRLSVRKSRFLISTKL